MFASFEKALRRGFAFRFGFRVRGFAAPIMALCMGAFYLVWWGLLATVYLLYGLCWLCYKLVKWFGQGCFLVWKWLLYMPVKKLLDKLASKGKE